MPRKSPKLDQLRHFLGTYDPLPFNGTLRELVELLLDDRDALYIRKLRLRRKYQVFLHSKNVSQCTGCLRVKGRNGFSSHPTASGFRNVCLDCQKLLYDYDTVKIRLAKTAKQRKEYRCKYYAENREKILEYQRNIYKQKKLKKFRETLEKKQVSQSG